MQNQITTDELMKIIGEQFVQIRLLSQAVQSMKSENDMLKKQLEKEGE